VESLRRDPRRLARRSLVLAIGAWPCLLISPYALHLPGYYEQILFGGDFSRFVTEWAPTTLTIGTAPVYLLVLAGMWLLGRAGAHVSTFEKLALLATGVLAFQALRNTAWLGLTALVVLPVLLDAVRPAADEPRRLNRLLATIVVAGAVVAAGGIAAKGQSWFVGGFPTAAADAASAAAGPDGKVLAMSPYADWLRWRKPGLAGRVAFDARFELLTRGQLKRLGAFQARAGAWISTTRGYRVFVLGRNDDRKLRAALVTAGVARVVHLDRFIAVLQRTG
jgi:hypothetical protein